MLTWTASPLIVTTVLTPAPESPLPNMVNNPPGAMPAVKDAPFTTPPSDNIVRSWGAIASTCAGRLALYDAGAEADRSEAVPPLPRSVSVAR